MRRSIGSACALIVLLAAGACGGSTAATTPPPQPTASIAPSTGAAACHTPAANEPLTTPVGVAIADRSYEAGTYAYHCRVHSIMHGTITIVP